MNYHFRLARTMSFRKCVHIHIDDTFTILYYRSLSIYLYLYISLYLNSLLCRPYIGHSETRHMAGPCDGRSHHVTGPCKQLDGSTRHKYRNSPPSHRRRSKPSTRAEKGRDKIPRPREHQFPYIPPTKNSQTTLQKMSKVSLSLKQRKIKYCNSVNSQSVQG